MQGAPEGGDAASSPSSFATDKVQLGYLPAYEHIAAELGINARVCEIGVYEGGSLRMWQELFPHGLVVGVDNNEYASWPFGTVRIVAEQTDPQLPQWLHSIANAYDLIVDDASHEGLRSQQTFELLWPLVAPGGYYVLEDWQVGFDNWSGHGPHQPGMLVLAHWFLGLLDHPGGEVHSIEYRYGMVILRRSTDV